MFFKSTIIFVLLLIIVSCNPADKTPDKENAKLNGLFAGYFEDRLKLFPLEATAIGDSRYNNLLPVDFSESYRDTLKLFYTRYLNAIKAYDRDKLNANDRISYDIFKREMEISLYNFDFPDNYMPFNQFYALPLTMGQLGSGDGIQPFQTPQDYINWLERVKKFSMWCDSAIVYLQKGIDAQITLPKTLVEKIIPQLRAMETSNAVKSLFYGPVAKIPASFPDSVKSALTTSYSKAINEQMNPSFKKLGDFLQTKYLPKARTSTGIDALPGGKERYKYLIRYWTTTGKQPDEIYNIGLSEVKRIKTEMEKTKGQTAFTGDLPAFFEFMKRDKQFMPYSTADEVLNAFRSIQKNIDPNLRKMFSRAPKTPFEIRQTEAFRAASASAEYNQGAPDGSRPGVFYVPILNAKTFNTTSGMESLFLHETIPGHHYQISLQQENDSLPKFRRFSWYGAYGEGWALYCESLGKELGLYTDPYQYMGALGDEMHRAIRLVVDVGMHHKGWSREQAIKYMMENEAISEQGAVAEIERYMALPAQALSYKIGALKISELRNRFKSTIGKNFSLAAFHDSFLKDGCMPLDVIEKKMDDWAAQQQSR